MSKKGMSGIAVFGAILIIILLGIVAYGTYQSIGGKPSGIGSCPDSSATVKWASDNLLNASSLASPTVSCKESTDGGSTYSEAVANTTSYPVGAKLRCLASGTTFLNAVTDYDVPCGGGNLIVKAFGTSAPTLKMWDDDGNPLTDADDATQNVSRVPAGGSSSIQLRVLSKNDQSTGDMIIILKSDVANETASFSVSGADCSSAYAPSFSVSPELVGFAGSGANIVGACKVSPVKDADSETYDITIQAKSGAPIGNSTMNLSLYGIQAFEDSDGSFKVGIEDSSGAKQYAWAQSFTFYFDRS